MDRTEITGILEDAESAIANGSPIGPSGFWRVVNALKADQGLVDEFGDRVSEIDRRSFQQWALVTVPLWAGNTLMTGGTLVGFALIWWAYNLGGVLSGLVFLLGFAIVLTTTHGLAHLVVGSLVGIRFQAWFVGTVKMPQPGVKVVYSSYLRTPAKSRAWMHAAGALTTKAMPFLLLGAAYGADVSGWVVVILLGVGVGSIITDAVWSTKSSDWKKFKREMEFA
jgi:hypothetical protein